MQRFRATLIECAADTDYGEGWIEFRWPDEHLGWERLHIDLDGHCSRRMPLRSGSDGLKDIELFHDRIRISFSEALAKILELEPLVEIEFSASAAEYNDLQRAVAYLGGRT